MKVTQKVGGCVVEAKYYPSGDGWTPDFFCVTVRTPEYLVRSVLVPDPSEDTIALFMGCQESGFLAPFVDWCQERATNTADYETLGEIASAWTR